LIFTGETVAHAIAATVTTALQMPAVLPMTSSSCLHRHRKRDATVGCGRFRMKFVLLDEGAGFPATLATWK
jgi:hypothetical protein